MPNYKPRQRQKPKENKLGINNGQKEGKLKDLGASRTGGEETENGRSSKTRGRKENVRGGRREEEGGATKGGKGGKGAQRVGRVHEGGDGEGEGG